MTIDGVSIVMEFITHLIISLLDFTNHTDKCSQPFTVSNRRCMVTASNGRRSLSSGFPNYPRPQLPSSHSNRSQQPNCNFSTSKGNESSLELPVSMKASANERAQICQGDQPCQCRVNTNSASIGVISREYPFRI
jgi:hypothetical protein